MAFPSAVLIVMIAGATPKSGVPGPRCRAALSVDQKFGKIVNHANRTSEYKIQLTHLLNEAFAPVLCEVRDRVERLSFADLETRLGGWTPAIKSFRRTGEFLKGLDSLNSRRAQRLRYDGKFTGVFKTDTALKAPFTSYNKKVIRRLLRALGYIEALEATWKTELEHSAAFQGATQLLSALTFGGSNLMRTMNASNDAVALGAAQLIATPVQSFDAETLLKYVMRAPAGDVSLMVRYSLMLPPAVLGPYGDRVFVRNPLEWNDPRLTFSAAFRAFIGRARSEFNRWEPQHYEFGHGCPVAHREPGRSTSALQDYLDAVMHVYGLLEESERPAFGPMRDDEGRAIR